MSKASGTTRASSKSSPRGLSLLDGLRVGDTFDGRNAEGEYVGYEVVKRGGKFLWISHQTLLDSAGNEYARTSDIQETADTLSALRRKIINEGYNVKKR